MNTIPGLKDIRGLDPIGIWPLAPGWWILLGLSIVFMAVAAFIYFRKQAKARSWQKRALDQLNQIEANLRPENSYESVLSLAVLIRQLAIRKASRKECASLKGDAWLQWLTEKDAAKFDWRNSSRFLITTPYAPKDAECDTKSIKQTIHAAKGWVK